MPSRSSKLAALAAAILLGGGCGDGPSGPESRVATVRVSPATAAVATLGRTVQFSAQALDANGAVVAGVRPVWTSSSAIVATVDSSGVVTAKAPGEADIVARVGTLTGVARIVVQQAASTIEVVLPADTLRSLGAQVSLAAVARDSGAAPITAAQVQWSSADTTVVRVSAAGIATAVAEGTATVLAQLGSAAGSAVVTVRQAVHSVAIAASADTAGAFGQQVTFTAVAHDSLGAVVAGREVEWTSSATGVASIDANGRATALTNGTTSITATVEGRTATRPLVVDVRGAVRVVVEVTGGGEDGDGFVVHLGEDARPIDGGASVLFDRLVPGPWSASLGDLASICFPLHDRENGSVAAGDTVLVTFRVRCVGDYAYEQRVGDEYELRYVNRHGTIATVATQLVLESWAWSPDGSRLAFSSRQGGSADLYVSNADGTGRVRLTSHPDDDTHPSWSPDGRHIVFRSHGDGGPVRLYIASADGTELRQLLEMQWADPNPAAPAWSPAGNLIAYEKQAPDASSIDIWTIAPDGSNDRILGASGTWTTAPVWSPDGSWLAFEAAAAGAWDLRVIRPDGTGERTVATSGQGRLLPNWSADGQRIAFVTFGSQYEIAVIGFDGSNEQVLTPDYRAAFHPAWTRDGEHVLFMAVADAVSRLEAMSADGSGKQVLLGPAGERMVRARP